MKTITTLTIAMLTFTGVAAADTINVSELPQPVTQVLQEYFPGSQPLKAETDEDDGQVEYDVEIQYKDIKLDVEVTAEGKITDVDLDDDSDD